MREDRNKTEVIAYANKGYAYLSNYYNLYLFIFTIIFKGFVN